MIFRKSLSKKKGKAYSFFTGLEAAAVPAGLILLILLVFMVIMPMSEFTFRLEQLEQDMQSTSLRQTIKFIAFGDLFSPELFSYIACLIVAFLSILCAVMIFKFITDKKTVNVYYSLGIKRSSLFLSRYFAGALLLSLAPMIAVILSFIVNLAYVGLSWQLSVSLLCLYFGFTALSLLCYSVTAAVLSSVGTVSEAAVFSGAVLIMPSVIIYCVEQLFSAFVKTSTYGAYILPFSSAQSYNYSAQSMLFDTARYNPLLFMVFNINNCAAGIIQDDKVLSSSETAFTIPSLMSVLPWFLVALAVLGVACLLFKRRKAEECGFLNTNKILANMLIFELILFSACIFLNSLRYNDTLYVIVCSVALSFVLYLAVEVFLKRNFLKIIKTLYKYAIHALAALLIVGMFNMGLPAHASYVPNVNDVASVAVSFPAELSLLTLRDDIDMEVYAGEFVRMKTRTGLYELPEMTGEKDIKKAISFHRELVAGNEPNAVNGVSVSLRYTLKNGQEKSRRYIVTNRELIAKNLSFLDSDACKAQLTKIFTEKVEMTKTNRITSEEYERLKYSIFNYDTALLSAISSNLIESRELKLSESEFDALKQAMLKDLIAQTAEEYFNASYRQLGYIRFSASYSQDSLMPDYDGVTFAETATQAELESRPSEEISEAGGELTREDYPPEDAPFDEEINDVVQNFYTPYSSGAYDVLITENMPNTLNYLGSIGYGDCFASSKKIKSVSFRKADYSIMRNYYYYYNDFSSDCCEFFGEGISLAKRLDGLFSQNSIDEQIKYITENIITDEARINELLPLMRLHAYTYNEGFWCLLTYDDGSATSMYLSPEAAPDYVKNYNYSSEILTP